MKLPYEQAFQMHGSVLARAGIARRLMQVALPILASSLVGLFALLINTAIIGRGAPAGLYVLGIALPISFLQMSINESLRVSAIAFSSQAAGSSNLELLRRRLRGLLVLAVLIHLLLALAFQLGHGWLMSAYQIPAAQQSIVYSFILLNISTGALVALSISMMSSLYGLGQVFWVTLVTMLGFAANILVTFVLVYWGGWGVYALIVSTLLTSGVTIGWAALSLRRREALEPLSSRWLWRFWEHWPAIYAISMPVFAGYLILFVHSVLFNRLLALFAPSDVAGFGVAYRIQNIVLMPAIAIGIALAIHVNRIVAARRHEHTYRYISTAMGLSLAVFATLSGVVFVAREPLARLVTGDAAVIASASQYLQYMGPAYLVLGPLLTMLIFFEQTGNGIRSLVFNAVGFAVQLALAFYVARTYHSLTLVYEAIALSYLVSAMYILYELARSKRLDGQQISLIRTT